MENKVIKSFSEYIKYIEKECWENYVLFRGQRENRQAPYDLKPKIARRNSCEILSIEKNLFEDFKRFSVPYLGKNQPKDDWEWLTLAQHHGLPTRFLDWTRNPLAALWFIVNEPPRQHNSYGVLWIFKPDIDDFVNFQTDKSPFEINKTKVYEPAHIAKRITAQAACFTVHKYMNDKQKFLPLNKNKAYKHKLRKVIIEGKNYSKFRNQLDRCGINAVTLFADLDSLCRHIEWKNWKESLERQILKDIAADIF